MTARTKTISVADAAKALNVTPRTIRNRCADGSIPGAQHEAIDGRLEWRIPARTFADYAETYKPGKAGAPRKQE